MIDNYFLYSHHIDSLRKSTDQALQEHGYSGLLINSGIISNYFADDITVPFRPVGHFAHWCPLREPGQMLFYLSGQGPRLYIDNTPSYWHKSTIDLNDQWLDQFVVCDHQQLTDDLKQHQRLAYIGPEVAWVEDSATIASNPPELCQQLDANRRIKTEYEIANLREASALAAKGHRQLRDRFAAGWSELEIHLDYLRTVRLAEHQLPYSNIVAMDENAALLHYNHYRIRRYHSKVCLADCGAIKRGYIADISRTYFKHMMVANIFHELVLGMERVQQQICAEVRAGESFYDLHYRTHLAIAGLLHANDVIKVTGEEAVTEGLTKIFFPHGLGHSLGVQTHDVGSSMPNCQHSYPELKIFDKLRFRGRLQRDMVITIEPGLYFIPLLLDEHRPQEKRINWQVIDELLPLGGIRIEDNVWVQDKGMVNLTREHLGNEPIIKEWTCYEE